MKSMEDFSFIHTQILRTASAKMHFADNQLVRVLQTLSAKFENVMKPLYCSLLLLILTITAFSQTNIKSGCIYYAIDEQDSVCLDAHVNVEPEEIDSFIKTGKKDILLIFDTWVNWGSRLLSSRNLKNEQIVEYLKKYKIITLYIDDKLMTGGKDSLTIGKKNMLYEVDKFAAATQPYYIILKGGKAKCSSGYMPSYEKILAFFKRCE